MQCSACATGPRPLIRLRVMASTSPDLGGLPADPAREARIAERTDALCLQHMLSMGKHTYQLMPSVLLIAYLAVQEGAVLWAAVWFVAGIARMVYFYRLTRRLRSALDAPPGPTLIKVARVYFLAGAVAGWVLGMLFTRSNHM